MFGNDNNKNNSIAHGLNTGAKHIDVFNAI